MQFHNFLTHEECDHIINTATPRLERSGVVAQQGGSEISDIRTSFGTFLERGEGERAGSHSGQRVPCVLCVGGEWEVGEPHPARPTAHCLHQTR